MTQDIGRGELIDNLVQDLRLQNKQGAFNKVSAILVPTYPVNFRPIVRSVSVTNTNSALAIYTGTPTEDFYLQSVQLSIQSDVTADDTSAVINITQDGATLPVAVIAKLATSAQTREIAVSFPTPIKCDRNTNVRLTHTFTVGASATRAVVVGYVLLK